MESVSLANLIAMFALVAIGLLLDLSTTACHGLSYAPRTADTTRGSQRTPPGTGYPEAKSFSVPLTTVRADPTTAVATWKRLWNDPRPITSLIRDALDNKLVADDQNDDAVPFCLVSEMFLVDQRHRFQISLFPRGRFAAGSSTSFKANNGPAAAYLRYFPDRYGDEVDVAWRLTLVDTRTNSSLPVISSGGLPRSNTTWSAAMTFCADNEDIESCGRAADWGSSTWYQSAMCEAVASGSVEARGEITLYDSRTGESSFAIPPGGAVRAVYESGKDAGRAGKADPNRLSVMQERSFRVGEVIVPMADHPNEKVLEEAFVKAGTDYRIMTMSDKDGRPIFSTRDVPEDERKHVRLALRPCGWKLQKQMTQQTQSSRPVAVEWPVEVEAGLLSTSALSRFNLATAFPRVTTTVQRDVVGLLLAVGLALLPIPATLVARNFVSLYAIPSASMDPTLVKGDVLLVNKFPGSFDRTARGDVVLFRPPSALTEIAGSIDRNSLFVKRVVGLPGDTNIVLDPETKEVTVNGRKAAGPDRNLCEDEPLKLIDRFLENGKGINIERLEDGEVYVVGDCKTVSIDSRVFGVLPAENIAGKPVGRIWPPSRLTFKPL